MSEIKVNSIKGVAASTAAITVDNTAGSCTANVSSINNFYGYCAITHCGRSS